MLQHRAFWAIEKVRAGEFWVGDRREDELGLLPDPLWATLFFGWPGQSWTPPSAKGIQFMVDHLPANVNWSMSCMAPAVYWSTIAHGIAIGGHVRVGMEDCPYIEPGVYAKGNAELVERAVRMAREVGARDRHAGRGAAHHGFCRLESTLGSGQP